MLDRWSRRNNCFAAIVQAKAYREREYSSNPLGTGFYNSTKKDVISTAISFIEGLAQVGITNPILVAAILNRDLKAGLDGAAGTDGALMLWYLIWDAMILAGIDQEVVQKMKDGVNRVTSGLSRLVPDLPNLPEIPTFPPIRREDFANSTS